MTALDDRFWRKVMIGEWHECWEWNGCRVRGGYGMFSVGGTNIVCVPFHSPLELSQKKIRCRKLYVRRVVRHKV